MKKFKIYFWKRMPRGMFKEERKRYKNRLRDYMIVYICKDFKEMYELEDKLEKEELKRDYAARTYCYTKNFWDIESGEYVKTSPCCGHMVFNEEYFYMDSISHECGHAVIGYFTRKIVEMQDMYERIDEVGHLVSDKEESERCEIKEELFCYMLGSLANQIAIGYEDSENLPKKENVIE